jgi:hypothetical protein
MMRAWRVWREATTLFWQRPWLWVPTLSADLTAFFIQLLQKRFSHWLVLRLWARSVLTGEAERPTVFKVAITSGPVLWGSFFLHIALYATALFCTASLVRSIRAGGSEAPLMGLQFVRARWRSVIRVSFSMFGMMVTAIVSVAAGVSVVSVSNRPFSPWKAAYPAQVIVCCAAAWLLTGMAMRRIAIDCGQRIDATVLRLGRGFAAGAGGASLLLGFGGSYVQSSLIADGALRSAIGSLLINALASLAAALPYVLLFIALTLLVDGGAKELESPAADGHLPVTAAVEK